MELEAESLLGLPSRLKVAEAMTLRDSLKRLWEITVGEPPAELNSDLDRLRKWFDPVAQGQRLRRELADLEEIPDEVGIPGTPLSLEIGERKHLITPEGRCALELLQYLDLSEPEASVGLTETLQYDLCLARLYQEWSRHRIHSVVGLLAGTTKPLQIPAAGVVLALLVNRCTSEDRALTRFAAGSERQLVDRAFFAPVREFSDILAPSSRRNRTNPHLVSGWMLYEARRRLGDGLEVQDARAGRDGKVWIRVSAVPVVIERITRDLVRGHRSHATPERLGEAFDALVRELRAQLPSLAAFGLMHERPRETARLREQLLSQLTVQLEADSESDDVAS